MLARCIHDLYVNLHISIINCNKSIIIAKHEHDLSNSIYGSLAHCMQRIKSKGFPKKRTNKNIKK